MATREDIAEKAARKLGVLGIGQVLQSEITEDLDEAYVEVYEMLETLEMAAWDLTDDIPNQYAVPVSALVAMTRSTDYGLPQDRKAYVDAEGARAYQLIRMLQATRPMGTTVIENY